MSDNSDSHFLRTHFPEAVMLVAATIVFVIPVTIAAMSLLAGTPSPAALTEAFSTQQDELRTVRKDLFESLTVTQGELAGVKAQLENAEKVAADERTKTAGLQNEIIGLRAQLADATAIAVDERTKSAGLQSEVTRLKEQLVDAGAIADNEGIEKCVPSGLLGCLD